MYSDGGFVGCGFCWSGFVVYVDFWVCGFVDCDFCWSGFVVYVDFWVCGFVVYVVFRCWFMGLWCVLIYGFVVYVSLNPNQLLIWRRFQIQSGIRCTLSLKILFKFRWVWLCMEAKNLGLSFVFFVFGFKA